MNDSTTLPAVFTAHLGTLASIDWNTSSISSTAKNAYIQYFTVLEQCHSKTVEPSADVLLRAYLLPPIYMVGLLLIGITLPANFRLSRKRSAFLILMHIDILNILWLLQFHWLFVEFFLGAQLDLPYAPEGVLIRATNYATSLHYLLLALNRVMAIMLPFQYQQIFAIRHTKIFIAICWFAGISYSIFVNWPDEMRPRHCLSLFTWTEPSQFTFDYPFRLAAIRYSANIVSQAPFPLYMIGVAKLLRDFVARRITNQSAVVPLPTNSKERDQFENLLLERTRIFLICLFSTSPPLLAQAGQWIASASAEQAADQRWRTVSAIFSQTTNTAFHIQQPLLMMLLSSDTRKEIRKDLGRLATRFNINHRSSSQTN